MLYWILIQIVPISIFLYLYIKHRYNYWSKLGVKGTTPSIFKFGNIAEIQGQNPLKIEIDLFKKYGSTYGIYTGFDPTLTTADPELIKQVLIKDFPLFLNRRQTTTYHEMVNHSLFFTYNEQWKRMRTIASPAFTTGKLKRLSPLMNQCVDKLERYFNQLTTSGSVMENTREVLTGFTIETIASTSFRAQTRSNDDRTKVNPFVVNGSKISDIPAYQALCYFVMPKWINTLFNIEHPFNVESLDFFTKVTTAILKERKSSPEDGKQNNLIQMLISASKKSNYEATESYDSLTACMEKEFSELSSTSKSSSNTLTDKEIVGIATGIFAAGFDTTSLALTNCLYELSLNAELQERLYNELTRSLEGLAVDSEAYYDTIMSQIPLLDAVIKETLRKYPALARLERRCQSDTYKLGGIPLVKNQIVEISILAVHYSESLYPEPYKFNPDRFLPENKHQLVSCAFLPFGDGPRNCIGMRYAYQEIKLCLSRILRNFRFEVTPETPKSLNFLPFKFVLNSQPIPLKVVKRF